MKWFWRFWAVKVLRLQPGDVVVLGTNLSVSTAMAARDHFQGYFPQNLVVALPAEIPEIEIVRSVAAQEVTT